MNPERKIEPEKIHMLSIKTLKGNINGSGGTDPALILGHHFNFSLGTGINEEEKLVNIELTIEIEAIGKNEELLNISGAYTHEIIFMVENLDDFLETPEEGKEAGMDFLLNATLTGMAYSTIRGILFVRTQGTSLTTVILPVVDPKKIIGLPVTTAATN